MVGLLLVTDSSTGVHGNIVRLDLHITTTELRWLAPSKKIELLNPGWFAGKNPKTRNFSKCHLIQFKDTSKYVLCLNFEIQIFRALNTYTESIAQKLSFQGVSPQLLFFPFPLFHSFPDTFIFHPPSPPIAATLLPQTTT